MLAPSRPKLTPSWTQAEPKVVLGRGQVGSWMQLPRNHKNLDKQSCFICFLEVAGHKMAPRWPQLSPSLRHVGQLSPELAPRWPRNGFKMGLAGAQDHTKTVPKRLH